MHGTIHCNEIAMFLLVLGGIGYYWPDHTVLLESLKVVKCVIIKLMKFINNLHSICYLPLLDSATAPSTSNYFESREPCGNS